MPSAKSLMIPSCLAIALMACGGGGGAGSDPAPPAEAGGLWVGGWSGSGAAAGYTGPVVVEWHQTGTDLSGYATIPYLGMVNAPITGTVQGASITFGDVDHVISYAGTFSNAGSVSGHYHETSSGSDGTWRVDRLLSPFDDAPAADDPTGLWQASSFSGMGQANLDSTIQVVLSANEISGTLTQGSTVYPLAAGRISGATGWFAIQPTPVSITVSGGAMAASSASGEYIAYDTSIGSDPIDSGTWTATKN